MGEKLRMRLKMERVESPIQEATLNVLVAAGYFRERLEEICALKGVTTAQFNVLRILRGGPPEGYPRREILERMVERSPDCTRLIDRLEKRGLVRRNRTSSDRRLSLTQITPKGLQLVESLRDPLETFFRQLASKVTPHDQLELSRILEQLYAGES